MPILAPAHVAFRRRAGVVRARGLLRSRDDEPLPVSGAIIEAQWQWFFARVTLRLECRNASCETIEAFAALDVPLGWHVASFRAEVEAKHVSTQYRRIPWADHKLVVDDRATARATSDAGLLTAAVPWELASGQSCLLTVVFFCPASSVTRDAVILRLPRELMPQNPSAALTAAANATEAKQWSQRFSLPTVGRLPKSLLIHGKGTLFCAAAANPTVSISGASSSKQADPRRIEFKYDNRDLVQQLPAAMDVSVRMIPDEDPIMVHTVREDAPHIHPSDHYAMALCFAPSFPKLDDPLHANIELVILVDDSGSMSRHSASVSHSLKAFLHSLPDNIVVNVGVFGDDTTWLLDEGALATDAVVDGVCERLVLDGSRGSSKIHRALTGAYMKPVVAGYARYIVLITDGAETTFRTRSVDLVLDNTHTTMFGVVTIGAEADRAGLAWAAQRAGGTAAHIASGDECLAALTDVLKPHLRPHLTFMRVRYSYDGVEEVPPVRLCAARLPMVPAGGRAVIYAFGHKELRGCTIRVAALVGAEQREFTLHTGPVEKAEVNSCNERDASSVSVTHAAAAVSRIYSLVHASDASSLPVGERDEIVRLSEHFFVGSPYTALLGVGDGPLGGFNLVRHPFDEQRTDSSFPQPTIAPFRDPSGSAADADAFFAREKVRITTLPKILGWSDVHTVAEAVVCDLVTDVCQPFDVARSVLIHQHADGSWPIDKPLLWQALGLTTASVHDAMPPLDDVRADHWATAIIIAVLGKKFAAGDSKVYLAVLKANNLLDEISGGSKELRVAADAVAAHATL